MIHIDCTAHDFYVHFSYHKQIFELMCLLEELQTSQKAQLVNKQENDSATAVPETESEPAVQDLLTLHDDVDVGVDVGVDVPAALSTEPAEEVGPQSPATSVPCESVGMDPHAQVHSPGSSPSVHAGSTSPAGPTAATPILSSVSAGTGADAGAGAVSIAPGETPMPDFKSPALRSPINILVDEAQHQHRGQGQGRGKIDSDAQASTDRDLGLGLGLDLNMEMEEIVLSVHDDLRMNLDMSGEGDGEGEGGGIGIAGISVGSGGLLLQEQEEVLQVERLGDLSEETLAYLGEGDSTDQSDTLRWEEL